MLWHKIRGEMRAAGRGKSPGNIGDILSAGICILAMAVLMQAYMAHMSLIQKRMEVEELARKYILRMETLGYLTGEDQGALVRELEAMGISGIDLKGTSMYQTEYGNPIYLCIRGRIREKGVWRGSTFPGPALEEREFEFEERCMSTAKH